LKKKEKGKGKKKKKRDKVLSKGGEKVKGVRYRN